MLLAGILTDPLAPSTFGAWMNHAATHHIGAVSFLVVDFFLFFGVAVLTVVQASQVYSCGILGFGFYSSFLIFFISHASFSPL